MPLPRHAFAQALKTVGAHFRSLRDPSDTSQGMFSSQVLELGVPSPGWHPIARRPR